jgi:hypothetical protein
VLIATITGPAAASTAVNASAALRSGSGIAANAETASATWRIIPPSMSVKGKNAVISALSILPFAYSIAPANPFSFESATSPAAPAAITWLFISA